MALSDSIRNFSYSWAFLSPLPPKSQPTLLTFLHNLPVKIFWNNLRRYANTEAEAVPLNKQWTKKESDVIWIGLTEKTPEHNQTVGRVA